MKPLKIIKAELVPTKVELVRANRDIQEVWYAGVCFGQIRPKGTPLGVRWGWNAYSGGRWYGTAEDAAYNRVLAELEGRNRAHWRDRINDKASEERLPFALGLCRKVQEA